MNVDESNGICFDRKLFGSHDFLDHDNHYPFLWNDIAAAIIWFIAAGVATASGVGGGGIYVPLGIILLRFSSKPSTGLSQASIFGASVGGLILNLRNNHPDTKIRDTVGKRSKDLKVIPYESGKSKAEIAKDEQQYLSLDNGEHKFYTRPLIDYDMALFLAPMEMAGAVLGVIIQKLMPNWLFLSLAGIILGLTAWKTYKKFLSSYKKDKENLEKMRLVEDKEQDENSNRGEEDDADLSYAEDQESQAMDNDNVITYTEGKILAEHNEDEIVLEDNEEKLTKRRQLLEQDSRQLPWEKIVYLFGLWAGLAVIVFLKGGKGVESLVGITCKSPWYGILVAFQFIWLLGVSALFGFKLIKRHIIRVECNYPFHENDVLWDTAKLRFYASVTFLAGIVAGLVGIGGGMVLGPLMLVMNIHPRVSSATTATMVMLTSSSVAVIYVTSGLVPWEYAVFFFFICFMGAFIGKKYIDAYVKKTGMASLLIGILAAIIALATVGCFVIVILNLNKADWCFDGFKPFCVVKDVDELNCPTTQELSPSEMFPF